MKIAQISQHYLPIIGGQEVYIDNLNRVFRDSGWETVVYQLDRGMKRADVVTIPRSRILSKLIRGSEPYLLNFLLRLLKGGELGRADVVVAHYAFHAFAFRHFKKKPIVLSHGIEWHLENQTSDDREHERRAKACLDEFPHVVNDTHYLRHFGYDLKPGTGCFTEVAPRKWFIPNCVDVDHFKRTEGIPAIRARKTILVPRQIVVDRGILLAIEAFKALAEEDKDLTLHIIGKIRPGAYIDSCRELVRKLELTERVIIQDHVTNAEMVDYYSSAVMTVIPTLRREGTSLSALESMACGTSTVSTNAAGLADLPTVQCDPNPQALAEAMGNTLLNLDVVAAEQNRAVRETFNLSNWATAWRSAIRSIANH